jgi:HAD superfamily hydrolase (TIGR01509 family)
LIISAVVFDLGGTLIEYAGTYGKWPELETPGFMAAYDFLIKQGVHLPGFRQIREVGFELLPGRWQQAAAGRRNLRLLDLLQEVLLRCGVPDVPAATLEAAAGQYESAVTSQATMIPRAQETLAQVRAQGYRIGLICNTMFTSAAHRADLARFGLIHYFDTMLFSADANKWKPNAAPFLQVLADLDVAPDAAVYVGDDPASDVVGGQSAGMHTIHLKSSQRFHQPVEVKPDAQIHSLSELMPLLILWANGGHISGH